MDSLDWYKGKDVKADQESRGRNAQTLHYLVAALLQAHEEDLTIEQMTKMLYEINDYMPEKKTVKSLLQGMGF